MKRSTTVRSSLALPAILLGAAMFSGLFLFEKSHSRQYAPVATAKADNDKDAGAAGMAKFFFNARRNVATNSMDYAAMLKVDEQIRNTNRKATSTMGLFWRSMGPSNIGGRTRAILIDKKDPSGQTVFAGGVSGGLWKSRDGGASWDSINDNLSNICVSCIAQDANGNIFIGTGEGFSIYVTGQAFSTGILGGGMFESTDDGATFTQVAATKPASSNSVGIAWSYTNRIAILPQNPQVIYAATVAGLEVSTNGGTTFALAKNAGGTNLGSNTLDVKASEDGKIVVACIGGVIYYCYPATSPTTFIAAHNTGYGAVPSTGGGRIELAIAPGNSDYIYASLVGAGSNFIGIYFTMTAVKSGVGGYWYEIGPGNSLSFDPYGEPGASGAQGQGDYDNTIGVFPNNPGKALFGGTTLWSWTQASPGDSAGGWTSISHYFPFGLGDTKYVHPDMHNITVSEVNPNVVYIGCDGGIFKSYDGANTWQPENRDYDVTQFYAVACAPYVNSNGEGLMGGTQDNGTPYISGNGLGNNGIYPQDAVDVGGGDGGQCAISSINPNAYYASSDYNSLLRAATLSTLGLPANAYSATIGLNKGANIDSVANLRTGCFVDPIALYENAYDTTTLDSIIFVSKKAYKVGDTIYPTSPNGQIPYPIILKNAIPINDTFKVQNRVVSKIATGFEASNRVWIMMQAADFSDAEVWMPIGGPESKPDAFTGADPVHCLAWSANGDALFVGTEGGQFYRFSNLDSIVDTSYITGGIMSVPNGTHTAVVNPNTRVISKKLTTALAGIGGSDILSISVDPKNGNNVMVTVGNYANQTHVYFSNNALSAAPTFASAQGTLPQMPVYGSMLNVINSPYPKGAVVATEHGIYSTQDVTVASPTWSADNNGMANTIVCAIKQQTLPPWDCNNSGDIYIGTHGRGFYVDTAFFIPTGVKPVVASSLKVSMSIYPNPMNAGGTISFTLAKKDDVTITIYDVQGRMVKEIPVAGTPGTHNVSISTQEMPTGVYLATLTGTDFRQTTRFVVAR